MGDNKGNEDIQKLDEISFVVVDGNNLAPDTDKKILNTE